jgi:hypothetical protein
VVVFLAAHLEQVGGVRQVGPRFFQRQDDRFQRLLLFTEVLGAFLVVPDGRILEFLVDLF